MRGSRSERRSSARKRSALASASAATSRSCSAAARSRASKPARVEPVGERATASRRPRVAQRDVERVACGPRAARAPDGADRRRRRARLRAELRGPAAVERRGAPRALRAAHQAAHRREAQRRAVFVARDPEQSRPGRASRGTDPRRCGRRAARARGSSTDRGRARRARARRCTRGSRRRAVRAPPEQRRGSRAPKSANQMHWAADMRIPWRRSRPIAGSSSASRRRLLHARVSYRARVEWAVRVSPISECGVASTIATGTISPGAGPGPGPGIEVHHPMPRVAARELVRRAGSRPSTSTSVALADPAAVGREREPAEQLLERLEPLLGHGGRARRPAASRRRGAGPRRVLEARSRRRSRPRAPARASPRSRRRSRPGSRRSGRS